MKKIILTILIFLTVTGLKAQTHGLYIAIGGNIFFGDLGGGEKNSSHILGLGDADFASSNPAVKLDWQFKPYKTLGLRAGVMISKVAGDDANSKNESAKNRNLSFRSNIMSYCLSLDYYFVREKTLAKFEQVKFSDRLSVYFTVGFGLFRFNPQGFYGGQWYDLQPLCTEGQGTNCTYKNGNGVFTTADKPYSLTAFEIPFGLGFNIALNSEMSVGLELSFHFTTTDYIDDCSTNYFNWAEMGYEPESEMSVIFADRSKDQTRLQTGAARGNSGYNDAFATLMLTTHYNFGAIFGGLKHRK